MGSWQQSACRVSSPLCRKKSCLPTRPLHTATLQGGRRQAPVAHQLLSALLQVTKATQQGLNPGHTLNSYGVMQPLGQSPGTCAWIRVSF